MLSVGRAERRHGQSVRLSALVVVVVGALPQPPVHMAVAAVSEEPLQAVAGWPMDEVDDDADAMVERVMAEAAELERQGETLDAKLAYESLLEESPDRIDVQARLGALLRATGQHADAAAAFQRAGRMWEDAAGPGALDPLAAADLAHEIGAAFAQGAEYARAARFLNEATRLAPAMTTAHVYLAQALELSGERRAAARAYAAALRASGGRDADAHFGLANILAAETDDGGADSGTAGVTGGGADGATATSEVSDGVDRRGMAIAHYRRAVALRPAFVAAHNNMAQLHARSDRGAEAEARSMWLQIGLQVGSKSAPNRLRIGSESAPNRLRVGSESAPSRLQVGPI